MRSLTSLVLLISASSFADAIDVQLKARALKGEGEPPHLLIRIDEPIAGFRVQLKRSDGQTIDLKGGGAVGQTRTIRLAHPEGVMHWEGGISVRYPNATDGFMPLNFTTEYFGPLQLSMSSNDVDLDKRAVRFKLTRPAGKAKVSIRLDTGELAYEGEVDLGGQDAGSPVEVTWPEVQGRILQIDIKAFDTMNYFTGVELRPWRIDIPHEDVQFDSGKHDIKADQQVKIDDSVKRVVDEVRRYGKLASVRLFVVGHTDTVGALEMNRALSVRRAKSLAEYFRRKGVSIPILYEGLGEEALLVGTNDEVDEPKNRRAEYILSIDPPTVTNARVPPAWKRL